MAKRPVVSTINSVQDIVDTSNQNFTNIKEKFDNTLSLDGSTPNNMEADLDMNGYDLLNVKSLHTDDITVAGGSLVDVLAATGTNAANAAASEANAATSASEASTSAAEAALYDGPKFDTFNDFITSNLTFTVGEYVRVIDIGAVYQATASTGNLGQTNAGGQEFDVLPFEGNKYHVSACGAVGGVDEEAIIQAFAESLPSGSELHFDGSKTYILNIALTKAIKIFLNGATLTPASDTFTISIQPPENTITAYAVVETSILYKSTQFTVVGASTLFNVGDIGVLHDGALRPSDNQPVNFLAVKISNIVGDVVTIEGFTRTHLGVAGGSITFRHSTAQLKNAGVFDGTFDIPASNNWVAVFMRDIERPSYGGIITKGTTAASISIRNSYDLQGGTLLCSEPSATGSGQGYGLSLIGVSEGETGRTRGIGMRHAWDGDSIYGLDIGLVTDPDAKSVPVLFGHNGFAGHLRIRGFQGIVHTGAYVIGGSAQGYGTGSLRALRENHLYRKIEIGRTDVMMRNLDPDDFAVLLYFQNGVKDCDPGVLTFNMESSAALTAASDSVAVRVNGPVLGEFAMSVSGTRIGTLFYRLDDHGYVGQQGNMILRSGDVLQCRRIAFVRGGGVFKGGPVVIGSTVSEPLYQFDIIGSNVLDRVDVETPKYDVTNRQIVAASNVVEGTLSLNQRSSGASISSPNGRVLTQSEIQNRSGWLRIVADTGTGTDTLGAFPAPVFNGQTLIVHAWNAGRKDVTIPAGAGVQFDITFNSTTPVRTLRGYAGKWVAS